MVLMNLFTGQHGYADIENRLMDTGGGGRRVGWNEWREQHGSIYTVLCACSVRFDSLQPHGL